MAIEEIKGVEDDDILAFPVDYTLHRYLLINLLGIALQQRNVYPSQTKIRLKKLPVLCIDGHGMIDPKTNGKILHVFSAARIAVCIGHDMDAWKNHALYRDILRAAGWTALPREHSRLQGNQMAIVRSCVHFTDRMRQNVSMPQHIHLRFWRVLLKSRSMRKILTVNDAIVAQIAPIALNGGMRK